MLMRRQHGLSGHLGHVEPGVHKGGDAALSSGWALDNRGIRTFGALLSTASRGDVEIATWLVLGEHHGGGKRALATYHDAHGSVHTVVDASL